MWQRNLPSVDGIAGNAHASCCWRCVTAQLLPSGTPPGLHSPHCTWRCCMRPQIPTNSRIQLCALCTPNLHSPLPNSCIGWKITKLAYRFSRNSPLKISAFGVHRTVEFFCWTPGLAAAAAAESRVRDNSSRGPRENLSAKSRIPRPL
jgi:hypothetical protein